MYLSTCQCLRSVHFIKHILLFCLKQQVYYERILRFMRPLMVSPAHFNFSPNTFNKLPGAKPRHFAFFGENSTEALQIYASWQLNSFNVIYEQPEILEGDIIEGVERWQPSSELPKFDSKWEPLNGTVFYMYLWVEWGGGFNNLSEL